MQVPRSQVKPLDLGKRVRKQTQPYGWNSSTNGVSNSKKRAVLRTDENMNIIPKRKKFTKTSGLEAPPIVLVCTICTDEMTPSSSTQSGCLKSQVIVGCCKQSICRGCLLRLAHLRTKSDSVDKPQCPYCKSYVSNFSNLPKLSAITEMCFVTKEVYEKEVHGLRNSVESVRAQYDSSTVLRPHLLHRISVAEEGIDHYSSIAIPATFKKLSNHNQPISDATKTIKLMGRLSEIVTELIELRKVLATIRNDLCVRVGRAEGREAAETLPSGVPVAVNIPTTSEMSVLTDVEVGENTPEVIVIDN